MTYNDQIYNLIVNLSETDLLNRIAETMSDLGTKSKSERRSAILRKRARMIEELVTSEGWLNAWLTG